MAPNYSELLEAAVAAHFLLDLGCSFELSGLRLPESAHPASLMRTCLQGAFWALGIWTVCLHPGIEDQKVFSNHSRQTQPSNETIQQGCHFFRCPCQHCRIYTECNVAPTSCHFILHEGYASPTDHTQHTSPPRMGGWFYSLPSAPTPHVGSTL